MFILFTDAEAKAVNVSGGIKLEVYNEEAVKCKQPVYMMVYQNLLEKNYENHDKF
jgi:hypothetical protein